MTNKEAIELLKIDLKDYEKEFKASGIYKADVDCLKLAIAALELVDDFERAQIITGGRLNGRTHAYKCGLADGKRYIVEQMCALLEKDGESGDAE